MGVAAELRAIDLRSSHQFEEEIGNASSENGLLIHKTEFSVWTRRNEKKLAEGSVKMQDLVKTAASRLMI